jgi:hemerythrin
MISVDRFKTGLHWMDNQHGELVDMTIELFNSIEQGRPERNTAALLEFLDRYVFKHFAIEDEHMHVYEYPEVDAHLAEHANFEYLLTGLKTEFADRGPSPYLSGKVKRHLLDWLVNHIGETDKKLADFLIERGVAPDAPALIQAESPEQEVDQETRKRIAE